jgi:hypothetical protein
MQTSAGTGDRLGLATPGHARALRGTGIAPIFAQQSIREMTRTGRTPEEVLADATWGAFQAGWRAPVGADADHLKTLDDVDCTVAAGFSFYTVDPGEHVDSRADQASSDDLRAKLNALPWDRLETSLADLEARFAGQTFDLGGLPFRLSREVVWRAAVKYGGAVAHIARMYRHLVAKGLPFELEVSVDETETPTTHAEHYYVASEMKRLGVRWVSLAPRFVGRFEKGVDYIGDLAAFEADVTVHAAIARTFGPYKLSLHSGSDKFRIYDAVARETRGLVHLKTAGTSYLEALRTVAAADPALFGEIYAFSRDRYEIDRASYHVSATLEQAPAGGQLEASAAERLLDDFHARQVLHVTFGSVVSAKDDEGRLRFADRLMALLRREQDSYTGNLLRHFRRHLEPFTKA